LRAASFSAKNTCEMNQPSGSNSTAAKAFMKMIRRLDERRSVPRSMQFGKRRPWTHSVQSSLS
jgi:hypothetical protein